MEEEAFIENFLYWFSGDEMSLKEAAVQQSGNQPSWEENVCPQKGRRLGHGKKPAGLLPPSKGWAGMGPALLLRCRDPRQGVIYLLSGGYVI